MRLPQRQDELVDRMPHDPDSHRAAGGDAVLVLDPSGNVALAEGPVEDVFGGPAIRSAGDMLARLEFSPDEGVAFDGPPATVVARLRNGERSRWIEVSTYPVGRDLVGSGRAQTLVVARDVSVVRRSSDLREAFASVVSHELRTPVTTIYGGAQLLVDPAMSEATRSEAAAAVAEEAEHLYRVVEDLVVLARYDQPLTTTDDPVLLQRFVPEVVASEASRGGVRVTVDVPPGLPAVVARGGYVEQVVRHLVTSAVRFSPRDGAVSVMARVAGEAVEVRVRDSGSSITETEAAQVFDLFHRSARTVTDASGANMSLFVCKRLVEAMGGRIWARPREHDAGVELGFSLQIARGDE